VLVVWHSTFLSNWEPTDILLLLLRRKLRFDFLHVFRDVAPQSVEFIEDQVHDAVLRGRHQALEKSSPVADLLAIGLYHFGAGGIIHRSASKGIAPFQPLSQYARGCRGWALFISIHFATIFWSNGELPRREFFLLLSSVPRQNQEHM
jgi:hypothetical protein